jgi:hypothetical protein
VTLPLLGTFIHRNGSPKPDDREGSTIPKAPEIPPIIGILETHQKEGCFDKMAAQRKCVDEIIALLTIKTNMKKGVAIIT